jgi:hypothetical protein
MDEYLGKQTPDLFRIDCLTAWISDYHPLLLLFLDDDVFVYVSCSFVYHCFKSVRYYL